MLNELINNHVIWLTAIILNLALFVITTMTQKKEVININYDYYISKLYSVKGILLEDIRVFFSMVSITALLFVVIPEHSFREGYFYVLMISTLFHLAYFIRYGPFLNEAVKQDIYKFAFKGLYTPLDNNNRNAVRTDKELSDRIVEYFNTYNVKTRKAFKEIFGPESFLYDPCENTCNYVSSKGSYYISYEFIELFQETDLQYEWLKELLDLLITDDSDINIENLTLALACVTVFGKQTDLFSVEFIDVIRPYLNMVKNNSKADTPKSNKERQLLKELYKYISLTLTRDNSIRFYKESERVYKSLLGSMCPMICRKYVDELLSDVETITNERVKSFVKSLCSDDPKKTNSREEVITTSNVC